MVSNSKTKYIIAQSRWYSEYVKNENMTGKIKKIKFSVCDKATRNVIEMVKVLKDDFK